MPRDSRYRFFIIMEFSALIILLSSFYFLGQQNKEGIPLSHFLLAVPILASLLTLIGFMGAMYLRWIDSTRGNEVKPVQKLLFWLLAVSLLVIWVLAVFKTYASL